jgi:hypothetical protein
MIKINIEKAKAIAHDIRRATREKEFEQLNSSIEKQLPGVSAEKIRDKYAVMQIAIDTAQTVDEIKAIIE